MANPKPWTPKWSDEGFIASGGQGSARRVREVGGERLCVLKTLNQQRDPERRGRMYREAAALRTLNHPGVPGFVETNADAFGDIAVPLYIVLEHVPGPTLEEACANGVLPPAAAEAMFRRILDILHYCHARNVVHRDLKPDNIILRAGAAEDPVIIDFGQSFNDVPPSEELTSTGHQLGNRFLALPELLTAGAAQRDPRSDLAQACGLFLFALTGSRPVLLVDANGGYPHQRDPARARLNGHPHAKNLMTFFDRAFALKIDVRWQSAPEVLTGLDRLSAAPADGSKLSYEQLLAASDEQFGDSADAEAQAQAHAAITRILKNLLNATGKAGADLKGRYQTFHGGFTVEGVNKSGEGRVGLVARHNSKVRFTPRFTVTARGTEFAIETGEVGAEVPFARVSSDPTADLHTMHAEACRYFVEGVLAQPVRPN